MKLNNFDMFKFLFALNTTMILYYFTLIVKSKIKKLLDELNETMAEIYFTPFLG